MKSSHLTVSIVILTLGLVGHTNARQEVQEYEVSDLNVAPEELVQLITSTIKVDTWDMNGGQGKISISESKSKEFLKVGQSKAVHEDVLGLLQCLRKIKKSPGSIVPIAARGFWSDTPRSAKLRSQLEQMIDFACEAKPLEDAIAALAKKCGVELVIDLKSVMQAKFDISEPKTISIKETPLSEVLDTMLAPGLSVELFDDKLNIGVFTVRKNDCPAIYPIGDLLEKQSLVSLIQSIENNVTHDDWSAVGGNAMLRVYRNNDSECIVVSHTTAGHTALSKHLQNLRNK